MVPISDVTNLDVYHRATTIGTSDLSDVPTFLEDTVMGDLRHPVRLEEEGHCEERPRSQSSC
jgi:hypothetical protein